MDQTACNYTLVELLHLSYLFRDCFEYCYDQMQVTEETFNKRKIVVENMFKEGNFVSNWFKSQPKEDVKDVFNQMVSYFDLIYKQENYVLFETRKADPEKIIDFISETVKYYQASEDILLAFYNEFKKNNAPINDDIEKCIKASVDYYRVITNWVLFNQILKNDQEYKKALAAGKDSNAYEINYNLNILKRLISAFNFNKTKYTGDKMDIKEMFDVSFIAFKNLDGSIQQNYEQSHHGQKMSKEEIEESLKQSMSIAKNSCVNCLKTYEPIWRETYAKSIAYIKELQAKKAEA